MQSLNGAKAMLVKINFPREAVCMNILFMVLFNTTAQIVLVATALVFPVAVLTLMLACIAIGSLLTRPVFTGTSVARSRSNAAWRCGNRRAQATRETQNTWPVRVSRYVISCFARL